MMKSNVVQKPVATPVILFGISEGGKPRAGVFRGPDVDPALKAAQLLNLTVVKAETDEARKLSGHLPLGRITAKGEHIVPFVRGELYEKLQALAGAKPNDTGQPGPSTPVKTATRRLPANWTTSDQAISSLRKRTRKAAGGRQS